MNLLYAYAIATATISIMSSACSTAPLSGIPQVDDCLNFISGPEVARRNIHRHQRRAYSSSAL